MSSFNLRNLREISNDPLTKFTNEIAKKLSTFLNANQIDQLEDKEDIYSDGQDLETVIHFNGLNSQKKFTFDVQYFPPFEPDGNKVTLYLRGRNMGSTMDDISGFGNHATMNGDPLLIDGTPFDYGIHTQGVKSTALRFNRPTSANVNDEWINVIANFTMDVKALTTGISYFMRFRVSSLTSQGGHTRTLFEKTDDNTPDNGVQIQVTSTGRLRVSIKRAGVEYNQDTGTGVIAVNTVYDLWITYAVSGNVIKVYLNNVDITLGAGASPSWHSTLTNHDLFIFRKGLGTAAGFIEGDFYDFKVYREKVVSFNPIGNSVQFDGINDMVECGNQTTLWNQSLTKFSFSFWIYPTAGWDSNDRAAVWKTLDLDNGFACMIDPSVANRTNFNVRIGGNTFTAFNNNLVLNTWNHITCVYDNSLGSENVKIYVNGVVGTSANQTGTITDSGFTLELAGTNTDFKGNMKDFRWFTTKALTQTEINNIYDNNASAPTPDYWLKMTEGTGTPTDIITGTKTATLQNGASWITNEVGNMHTNKWTIQDIPFGQVMITDYYATYIP